MIDTTSMLETMIRLYEKSTGVHICIHDLTGTMQSIPDLILSKRHTIHASHICDCAKTTSAGLHMCLRNKSLAIKKAMKTESPYSGRCHIGISEYVLPVFFEKKILCIIFIGNILLDDSAGDLVVRQSKKSIRHTDVDLAVIKNAIPTTAQINGKDMTDIINFADILKRIILLVRQVSTVKKSKVPSSSTHINLSRSWQITTAINYITAYYDKDIPLSYISKICFINPQYLSRLFKKETNMTFTEYLNWVRIDNAKKLLLNTNEKILTISLKMGYNSPTYFNRIFKKNTGMSPSEYRELNK